MNVAESENREAQCCLLQLQGRQARAMLLSGEPDFGHGYIQAHRRENDGLDHQAVMG